MLFSHTGSMLSATFRGVLIAAFCAALTLFSLVPPANAAEKWTSVRSKNFFLIGDLDEHDIRQAAIHLEQFRHAARSLIPGLKFDDGVRTNIILFKDPLAYGSFKPQKSDGNPDDIVSGYFQAGEDVNYIALHFDPAKSRPYGTLYHE